MNILGLMSGTSLDGVDLALCSVDDGECRVIDAITVPYSAEWRRRLATLDTATALEYAKANVELGHFYGHIISNFIGDRKVDAIASHGHTVFHQPEVALTTQIGDGDAIAAETGLPVVSNFRTLDVALGGQGAPLVPIGDEMLFGQYDACLNLGGIANISYRAEGERIAFDICPCNMALNKIAAKLGLDYDPQGQNARSGKLNQNIKSKLDNIEYYRINAPKSLGKEWFLSCFWPIIEQSGMEPCDALATVTRHIADKIAETVKTNGIRTMLVTGGGALNNYLVECMKDAMSLVEITVPDKMIINYKEAMVFAYLGWLRLHGKTNTLASVTGAKCNSSGGCISGLLV